jgi:Rieske Fe-S protein
MKREGLMCDGSCGGRQLSRRAFLAETTMAAITAALTSACGDGIIGGTGITSPGFSGTLSVNVNDFPALGPVGGIARVDGGQTSPVAVVHTGTDTFQAFSMVCPHNGTTVNISGGGFRCPNHGATFTATGAWTGGQRTSNLFELPAVYDPATGMLQITGTAPPGGGGGDDDDDEEDDD